MVICKEKSIAAAKALQEQRLQAFRNPRRVRLGVREREVHERIRGHRAGHRAGLAPCAPQGVPPSSSNSWRACFLRRQAFPATWADT